MGLVVIWRSSDGDATIVEYLPGKQVSTCAAFAVVTPTAMTIDGSNNLWLQSGVPCFAVFDQNARIVTPVAQRTGTLGLWSGGALGMGRDEWQRGPDSGCRNNAPSSRQQRLDKFFLAMASRLGRMRTITSTSPTATDR
jgi:hypothetical protein